MANRKFVGFCLRYVKFFQRESRFGKKCIKYSEILRKKKQYPCTVNISNSKRQINLEGSAQQSEVISVYSLQFLSTSYSLSLKGNQNGLDLSKHYFLYNCELRIKMKHLLCDIRHLLQFQETIETFSSFSGLTTNIGKSNTAVLEAVVQVIAWGIIFIDLHKMG